MMTADPQCCLPQETVERAAQLMRSADIGPVPVVSDMEEKRLLGMVTDRDLALRVLAEGRDPRATKIEDVMSRQLVTCRADEDINTALDSMEANQVRRIAVVDDDGLLVGIIAQADIARQIDEEETGELVADISRPNGIGQRARTMAGSVRNSGSAGVATGLAGFGFGLAMMYLFDQQNRRKMARTANRAYGAVADTVQDYSGKARQYAEDLTDGGSRLTNRASKQARDYTADLSARASGLMGQAAGKARQYTRETADRQDRSEQRHRDEYRTSRNYSEAARQRPVRATQEHVAKLRKLIKEVRVCMFSTEDENGQWHSRPMYTQKAEFDGDLWFFTWADSHKVDELKRNPKVNVSFSGDNAWVSVSGRSKVVRDRQKIRELWRPDLKAFFPEGKDDPNIALLKVDVDSAEYWDSPNSGVVRAYGFAKSLATGKSYAEEFSDHQKVLLHR